MRSKAAGQGNLRLAETKEEEMMKKFSGMPCDQAWPQVTRRAQSPLAREQYQPVRRADFAECVLFGRRANVDRFDSLLKAFRKFDALKVDQSSQLDVGQTNEDLGDDHAS